MFRVGNKVSIVNKKGKRVAIGEVVGVNDDWGEKFKNAVYLDKEGLLHFRDRDLVLLRDTWE